jgi:translation initiation factor IF-2
MRPQGAQRCAPSQATCLILRSRPATPCSSRPRRRVSVAVHTRSRRGAQVHTSPPSPPPALWRMLPCASGDSGWPRRGSRGCGSARAPVDRPPSRAPWHRPAIAWALPPPSSLAPWLPRGGAAPALPCAPHSPVASGAAPAAAGSEKKHATLRPSPWPAPSHAGGSRLGRSCTRGPGGPRPARGAQRALGRGNARGALGPAPAGLGAPRPAGSPAHPPAAPGPEPTARQSPTADGGAVPLVAPPHAGRVAQRPRRWPLWPRHTLLSNRAARGCPGVPSRWPAREGALPPTWPRGGAGRRAQRQPAGAYACRASRSLARPGALPWLPCPWWASPQAHRRLRARQERRERRRTVFACSASALSAHTPRAHGPSGAPY